MPTRGRAGEHERVLVQFYVEGLGPSGTPSIVLGEQRDGLRVDRDTARLAGFAVLLSLAAGQLALADG
jgi:hypothetical protein